ncbi:hypothetical protein QBC46DRAFT_401340 [Diplogelasinospora grovesii]|uniref:Uncharacterized protein n=1 Tax=Diplogelasinospora grovesii TaxID=303347 RepID=A0AAN6MUN5_9PEZI|nr:hypothetical protein QBC46DRAFT_401340 [Diplogelasinospora grovesii]
MAQFIGDVQVMDDIMRMDPPIPTLPASTTTTAAAIPAPVRQSAAHDEEDRAEARHGRGIEAYNDPWRCDPCESRQPDETVAQFVQRLPPVRGAVPSPEPTDTWVIVPSNTTATTTTTTADQTHDVNMNDAHEPLPSSIVEDESDDDDQPEYYWIGNPDPAAYGQAKSTTPQQLDMFIRLGKSLLIDYRRRLLRAGIDISQPEVYQPWYDERQEVRKRYFRHRTGIYCRLAHAAKRFNLRSGKWMLFPELHKVNSTWQTVCEAVVAGKLGTGAKVRARRSTADKERIIYVYTRDFADHADVRRVLLSLVELGLVTRGQERSIRYKIEAYTHLGIYADNRYCLQASLFRSMHVLERIEQERWNRTQQEIQDMMDECGLDDPDPDRQPPPTPAEARQMEEGEDQAQKKEEVQRQSGQEHRQREYRQREYRHREHWHREHWHREHWHREQRHRYEPTQYRQFSRDEGPPRNEEVNDKEQENEDLAWQLCAA